MGAYLASPLHCCCLSKVRPWNTREMSLRLKV
jgi:hypothetical protein